MTSPNAGADRRLLAQVRTQLAAAGDPQRAAGQQRYMNSRLPFHGVTSAALERLLKPVYANHRLTERRVWEATVRALWDEATHREQWYAAITLAGHRYYREWQDVDALPLDRPPVVTGAGWDEVGSVAARRVGPVRAADRAQVTPTIRRWGTDHDMWIRRTAILAQLKHKADTDLELLADVLEANLDHSPHGTEFFIRKAVGWALREYAKTDPDWVRAFVAEVEDDLSPLSHREATKRL